MFSGPEDRERGLIDRKYDIARIAKVSALKVRHFRLL